MKMVDIEFIGLGGLIFTTRLGEDKYIWPTKTGVGVGKHRYSVDELTNAIAFGLRTAPEPRQSYFWLGADADQHHLRDGKEMDAA